MQFPGTTLFLGSSFQWHHEVTSTNDVMAEHAASLLEGAIIGADFQTAGRGYLGTKWQSAHAQNLTFSLLLKPGWLPLQAQFSLSKIVSLAVCDTVASFLPSKKISIKWPNDIYVENHKICGILIQSTLQGAKIAHSIIGIGLNVNQTHFDTEAGNATSLSIENGQPFSRQEVLNRLAQSLEQHYLLGKNNLRQTDEHYTERLYRLGKVATYRRETDGHTFAGIIRGVTPEGRLRIEHENGTESFGLKEVRFL